MTTTLEYALMAGASYISNRPKINRISAPDVWLENIQMRTAGVRGSADLGQNAMKCPQWPIAEGQETQSPAFAGLCSSSVRQT